MQRTPFPPLRSLNIYDIVNINYLMILPTTPFKVRLDLPAIITIDTGASNLIAPFITTLLPTNPPVISSQNIPLRQPNILTNTHRPTTRTISIRQIQLQLPQKRKVELAGTVVERILPGRNLRIPEMSDFAALLTADVEAEALGPVEESGSVYAVPLLDVADFVTGFGSWPSVMLKVWIVNWPDRMSLTPVVRHLMTLSR